MTKITHSDKFPGGHWRSAADDVDVVLPPPLDRPMEHKSVMYITEINIVLYELIERQNALVEIVKKLVMRA